VRRPFEGLAGETDWVALREILPAATAPVRFLADRAPLGAGLDALIATVLPMAWPGLHRADGTVLAATQSGATSGDASRDIAAALLLAVSAEEGSPVTHVPTPTAQAPRLQDLLDPAAPFEVTVHDGFGFWVGDTELDDAAAESLTRANETIAPTVRVHGAPSVYWVGIGQRCYVRWVLPHDEDLATDALARLHAAGASQLAADSRLLGAFRASGLLVPVWEVDRDVEPASLADDVAALAVRVADAVASTTPLTAGERRARNGLQSRQVTLR
jgi:hypothetical protein